MRLCFLETNLSRDERELWHFLAGFLPQRGLVKLRQLLQLGLGELLRIGGDRVLLDTLPVHILRQKPLQDLSLGSELRILLKLVFHDLFGNLRQALLDLHHEEQVFSSLAMTLGISQSNDRREPQGNHDQTVVQQHSHHTILLGIRIPHGGGHSQGTEEDSPATHPRSGVHASHACWIREPPACATSSNTFAISSGDTPFALRYMTTPSSSSPQKMPSMK